MNELIKLNKMLDEKVDQIVKLQDIIRNIPTIKDDDFITNISIKDEDTLGEILFEYCEKVGIIPTEEGKGFFEEWNNKVPAKLIRQTIFAGIYFALRHPDRIILEKE